MMSETANLKLQYLQASQADKHVSLNESVSILDQVIQISVVSQTQSDQPISPAIGDSFILPASRTGSEWISMTVGSLACYNDAGWREIKPKTGWTAWVRDTGQYLAWNGTSWSSAHLRNALSLGSAATKPLGTSGDVIGALNTQNTWALNQTFQGITVCKVDTATAYNDWIQFRPTDYGIGKPYFAIAKQGQADTWLLGLWDGASSSGKINIVAGTVSILDHKIFHAGASCIPSLDATIALGSAAKRFTQLYASTGVINTSDARAKTEFGNIPANVMRATNSLLGQIGTFKWADARAKKGNSARTHVGLTAQAVATAFTQSGADPHLWGLFCDDKLDDGTNRLGLRPDQFFYAALACLAGRIEDLERKGQKRVREKQG